MSDNKTIFLGNETLRILYPNKLFFCIQDNNESDWERINIDIKIKGFYNYEKGKRIIKDSAFSNEYFTIKPSNISGGGLGCFTNKYIEKGTTIGKYLGKIISEETFDRKKILIIFGRLIILTKQENLLTVNIKS